MLVLARYLNQQIRVGDDIIVTVVRVRGNEVRLGIIAPDNVPVHREEVYQTIKREEETNGL